jgi:hypothetical protein
MPFVTLIAQRYLHLGNTLKILYSPYDRDVTENPVAFPDHPVYLLGTSARYCSRIEPRIGPL